MFDVCKISSALTISKNTRAGARGTRALVACTNSLVCLRAKFRFNRGGGGGGGGCHKGIIKIGAS